VVARAVTGLDPFMWSQNEFGKDAAEHMLFAVHDFHQISFQGSCPQEGAPWIFPLPPHPSLIYAISSASSAY